MSKVGTGQVLLDKSSHTGSAYVELFDGGRVRAGYYRDTAKRYRSVDEALARFKESYTYSGNQAAFDICAALETYLAQRDEGR